MRGNRSITFKKTKNLAEYRKQLYSAFETAQADYLKRLDARGLKQEPLKQAIKSSSADDESFATCDPPTPSFKEMPGKLIKYGGTLKMQ